MLPELLMPDASNPSNWPDHEPEAGAVVLNPTHEVPPGQVLVGSLPAHHDSTGEAGAGQVPTGGTAEQLFCATAKPLHRASTSATR
jgi:hypothetical protein